MHLKWSYEPEQDPARDERLAQLRATKTALAFFALAMGFLILSRISADRASLVIYKYHRNLGYVVGVFFLLCFVCGLARAPQPH